MNFKTIARLSIVDLAFYSIMVGFGESYFSAYGLEIGMSEKLAGLYSVLPMVVGSFLQLLSGFATNRLKSAKHWILICASLQAVAILVTAYSSQLIDDRHTVFTVLFIASAIYWGAGFSAGPAWNALITQIIPRDQQQDFFFARTRVGQLCTLITILWGGYLLSHAYKSDVIIVFLALFTIAAMARLSSAVCLSFHPEPKNIELAAVDLKGLRKWIGRRYVRSTLLFIFLNNTCVYIAAPYFTPYMLEQLNLSFINYGILISSVFVSRFVFSFLLQGPTKRFGAKFLLYIGIFTICPLPYLWTLSDNFYYLLFLQIGSGFGWGSYELGMTLFLIETMPHAERSRLLSWSNLLSSLGMGLGVTMSYFMLQETIMNRSTYYFLFYLSSGLRLVPLVLVRGFVRELAVKNIPTRVLGVRPGGPAITKPILLDRE